MAFSVRILKRDFSAPLNLDGLSLRVISYSFHEEGGPEQAEIDVLGGREDLWELVELLRCPVEIMDEEEEVVWWGFLSQAEIHDGVMVDAVSLEAMYNRLALAYTTSIPGLSTPGDRVTTAWAEDADSIAAYGTKEILLSLPSATEAEAENARDYELTQRKYPLPVTTVGNGYVDAPQGRIVCRGWWDTLDWMSYTRAAGLEQNAETQGDVNLGGATETVIGTSHITLSGSQAFGNATATTKLEMSFSLAGAMTLTELAVRIQTNGSPADEVYLKLYSDSAGALGSLLATATISTGTITSSLAWVTETLDTPYAASATTYHLEISRSGGLDVVNYYTVSVDEGLGYTSGQFKIWNGSAWVARSPNADLAFRVWGEGVYTKIEQAFQLTGGEAWQASNVQIYAQAEGSPADSLRVRLYTDSSGAPGSLLATGTFTGSSVPSGAAWLTFELDSEVSLSLATTYHLQVDRTGATDATNYYVVGVDEGLHYYASYVMKVWNGAAWVRRAEDADLAFVIGGVEETTTQIATALADAEFITDVEIKQASGVNTNPYRNGDQRLLDVVRELLKAGISGGYRLLATVTKDRVVQLYQAPEKSAYAYLINRRGQISTATDGPVDLQKCPVAVWMRRTDIPGEANTERLVDLSKFYVEAAEFNVANGYTPTPRGAQRPFELPGQVSL